MVCKIISNDIIRLIINLPNGLGVKYKLSKKQIGISKYIAVMTKAIMDELNKLVEI